MRPAIAGSRAPCRNSKFILQLKANHAQIPPSLHTVYAYVIMENHLHLLASAEDLSKEVADFRSFTARQSIDYYHENPVRRDYVDKPEHWRYSSARDYAGIPGLVPVVIGW